MYRRVLIVHFTVQSLTLITCNPIIGFMDLVKRIEFIFLELFP